MADISLIFPRELNPAATVSASEAIPIDNGVTVQKATPTQIVNAGRPFATQAQAETGTDATVAMSPLTTKQAIEAVVPAVVTPFVELAEAWAESPNPPNPGVPDSKSAKTWADDARMSALDAQEAALYSVNTAQEFLSSSATYPIGGVVASKDGASWLVSANNNGWFNHPVTGQGLTPQGRGLPNPYAAQQYDLHASNTGSRNHAALQLAIDKAFDNAGGRIMLGRGAYAISDDVFIPSEVGIEGINQNQYYGSVGPYTRLNFASGKGLELAGNRASLVGTMVSNSGEKATVTISGDGCLVEKVGVDGGDLENIVLTSSSVASCVRDTILINGLRGRSAFTEYRGALDVGGTDHFIERVEANATSGFSSVTTGYAAAIISRGTNSFFSNTIGELSECGLVIANGSQLNRFSNTRLDLNMGHGLVWGNGSAVFSNLDLINNSQKGVDQYCGIIVIGPDASGSCDANIVNSLGGRLLYGIDSAGSTAAGSDLVFNIARSINVLNVARTYNFNPATINLGRRLRRVSLSSTSVSAENETRVLLTASSATTVNEILGGFHGQEIEIIDAGLSGNITIANGGTTTSGSQIFTKSGANTVLRGMRLVAVPRGGSPMRWYEV